MASREKIVTAIENGADVSAVDGGNGTPLDYALEFGRREIAELLRSAGASKPDSSSQ